MVYACVCVQEVHPVLHVSVRHQLQLCLRSPHDGLPLRPGQLPLTECALGETHGPAPLLSLWLLQQVWKQDWSVSPFSLCLWVLCCWGGGGVLKKRRWPETVGGSSCVFHWWNQGHSVVSTASHWSLTSCMSVHRVTTAKYILCVMGLTLSDRF